MRREQMKKVAVIMLAVFVLAAFTTAFAQERTAKGQIELGGTVAFYMYSDKYDGDKVESGSEINIYPSVGYFIIPKLELEPKLIVYSSSWKYEGGKTNSSSNIGGIFNVAYHFEGAVKGNAIPFVFAGIGMLSNSYKDDGETRKDVKTTMILPDAGVGIKYFITERGTIRAEVYYQRLDKAYGYDKLVETNIGLRAGISLFLK
jgi:hypothetical protein